MESPKFSGRRLRGFTLIEIMIVVAVLGILAAVALPQYSQHMRKSRRADAVALMAQVAQAQERWRANNSPYANDFGRDILNLRSNAASGVTTLSETYYAITVLNNTATAYTVRAVAQGTQAADTQCAAMEMRVNAGNVTYVSATSSSGITSSNTDANRCWSR